MNLNNGEVIIKRYSFEAIISFKAIAKEFTIIVERQ